MVFESPDHEKAWLIRVTINACKSYFTTAWFRKTTELSEDLIEKDYISLSLEQQDLFKQIRKLKVEDRNIIYLFYYEQYTIADIAKILGMNMNTVSTHLRRAKSKLRSFMEGEG